MCYLQLVNIASQYFFLDLHLQGFAMLANNYCSDLCFAAFKTWLVFPLTQQNIIIWVSTCCLMYPLSPFDVLLYCFLEICMAKLLHTLYHILLITTFSCAYHKIQNCSWLIINAFVCLYSLLTCHLWFISLRS